jgi:hypothetical protein
MQGHALPFYFIQNMDVHKKREHAMSTTARTLNVNASGVSAASHAHSHSSTATNKRYTTWPAATKPAFYAAFYAVDEATWGTIA